MRRAWLLKGMIALGLVTALFLALYLTVGQPLVLTVGGALNTAIWRGWWRARP